MTKKILYNIIWLAAISFVACNDINEDERWIDRTKADVARCILVEEYSGQLCTNCPDGAVELSNLQKKFGEDTLIVVCIHANAPTFAISEPYGFATQLCEDLYKLAGSPALPSIRINRSSPIEFNPIIWRESIEKSLKIPAGMNLNVENEFNSNKDSLFVTIKINSFMPIDGKLHVWITENNIKGVQMFKEGISQEYEHKHIFRTSITSDILQGDDVILQTNEEKQIIYKAKISPNWNKENIEIVAFVCNDNGVMGVAKKHLNITLN